MARNVNIEVKGKKLIITADLEEDFGYSKSGKSKIIASTDGAIAVPGKENMKVNMTIYKNNS